LKIKIKLLATPLVNSLSENLIQKITQLMWLNYRLSGVLVGTVALRSYWILTKF